MTLSSTIAIIATVLTSWLYCLTQLYFAPSQLEIDMASPKKRPWLKTLHIFNMDEAPTWRKILLKLLLSIFSITAIICGFYTVLAHLLTDVHIILRCVSAFIVACLAWVTIGFFCTAGIWDFSKTISNDFFELRKTNLNKTKSHKQVKIAIIVLNSAILCLWLALFIICLILGSNDIFSLIGFTTFLTAIIGFLLFAVGAIVFKVLLGIFALIHYYIKWLIK